MKRLLVVAALLLMSVSAWAGQAWFASPNGTPCAWPNGVIQWMADANDLADGYSNSKAIDLVKQAFATWAAAGLNDQTSHYVTVQLSPTMAGILGTGVNANAKDASNYYGLTAMNKLAKPLIIFDKVPVKTGNTTSGAILTEYCAMAGCTSYVDSILAMTVLDDGDMDYNTATIKHGFTILDGTKLFNSYPNGDAGEDRFKAAVIHEIGHLLGLDHTGTNDGWATVSDTAFHRSLNGKVTTNAIPTMYPVNLTKDQSTLHNDDVVAISTLYPASSFTSQFCTITGNVTDGGGTGVQGVMVQARTTMPADYATDVISTMSGANYPVPTRDGHYYIRGIIPGKKYNVGATSLPKFGSSGSSIGQFGYPTAFSLPNVGVAEPKFTIPCDGQPAEHCDAGGRDLTAAGGGTYEVSCDKGGQTIAMDALNLGSVTVDSQYATAPSPTVNNPAPAVAPAAGSSGGCALIR